MRRALDLLYIGAGALSALFLVALLIIVSAQIALRWLGVPFPGGTAYAGYCMAASSFLALAYALNAQAHIRVNVLLSRLEGRARHLVELWCLGVAACLSWWFAWYAIKAVRVSRMINDISQGQDATPLWIPQTAMAVGAVVLAIAFADQLIRAVLGRQIVAPDKYRKD